jgi:hypothetical protein
VPATEELVTREGAQGEGDEEEGSQTGLLVGSIIALLLMCGLWGYVMFLEVGRRKHTRRNQQEPPMSEAQVKEVPIDSEPEVYVEE